MNLLKNKLIPVFYLQFLVIMGCHNNAHLRTQKLLKPGEKSTSISGVLPVGGVIEGQDRTLSEETGVVGIRGEVSFLKGKIDSESGPYFGFGFHRDYPGFILGYDYRKYLKSRKQKLGAQFELNISEFGPLFHLRPSFSSVTRDSWPIYAGMHGILAYGKLKTWTNEIEFDYLDSNGDIIRHRIDEKINYNFNSLGAGVTFGLEINTLKNSFQLQTDITLVQNSWHSEYDHGINPEMIQPYRSHDQNLDIMEGFSHSDDPALLISASAGMSFFKPGKNNSSTFKPMPIPSNSTKQIKYDPNTGEKILDKSIKFDPETGERIKGLDEFNVDQIKDIKSGLNNYENWDDKKIISEAKLMANNKHNKDLHYGCGAGSCIASPFWGISILGSLIFANSNILTTFNEDEPAYTNLSGEYKYLFEQEYKREERSLRRRDISVAQKSCLGIMFGIMVFSIFSEGAL